MKNKTRGKIYVKIYMKTKYEIFSNETLNFFFRKFWPPTIWILPKLYELCESCRRNSLETYIYT